MTIKRSYGSKVIEKFDEAKRTFEGRQETYGGGGFGNYGDILSTLFPGGVKLETTEDFTRFWFICMLVTKMIRYAKNFDQGGHQDSSLDLGVYAFLLGAFDEKD